MRGQLRPARKPHERYLCLLTAVLLNELDRLLLQDAMRLSGAAYTVGGGRRGGPFFVCRDRCLIGPQVATRAPYGNASFSGGRPPGGIPQRGPRPPFGRFKERGLQGGEGNSKSLSPLTAFCLLCRRGQSRSPPAGGEIFHIQ